MRRVAILLACLAAAGASAALDGGDPAARLALRLGAPRAAAALADDPMLRGVALHRLGAYDAAAEAFRLAGARASFNRGNALARAGRLREAAEAYAAVLARDPGDDEARSDLALIEMLRDPPIGEARPGDDVGGDGTAAEGSTPSLVQAPGAGDGESGSASRRDDLNASLQAAMRDQQRRVRQRFEDRGVAADERWLATLRDQPGRYLKARIAVERARRAARGVAMPPAEDPR